MAVINAVWHRLPWFRRAAIPVASQIEAVEKTQAASQYRALAVAAL
jgi:hypothetical protein